MRASSWLLLLALACSCMEEVLVQLRPTSLSSLSLSAAAAAAATAAELLLLDCWAAGADEERSGGGRGGGVARADVEAAAVSARPSHPPPSAMPTITELDEGWGDEVEGPGAADDGEDEASGSLVPPRDVRRPLLT